MKIRQSGIGVACAAVLAGMVVFSYGAQARTLDLASTEAGATTERRAHVEIFDVQQVPAGSCIRQESVYVAVLDAVAAEHRALATQLGKDAVAALKQDLLVIELPGHKREVQELPPQALLSSAE